jgi:aminoglycoside N3'-acetyltransferase
VQRRPEVGLRVAWAGSASSGASCRKYSRRGWTSILPEASTAFERESGHAEGAVGEATATLASQRRLVDFAAEWFEANR